MNADDLIMISVDDHIAEPADMFEAHVPAKYKDLAPRLVTEEDGIEQWWYGNLRGRNIGLNADDIKHGARRIEEQVAAGETPRIVEGQ